MKITGTQNAVFNQILQSTYTKVREALSTWGMSHGAALEALEAMEVQVNPRMRSRAGCAHYTKNKVELNYRLLDGKPKEIESTFAHEIAHLAVFWVFGRRPTRAHGREWRLVMTRFGYPAERCHNLDVDRLKAKRRKWAYKAPCGAVFNVTIVRHRKIQEGKRYWCKCCKGALTYVGPVSE